MIESGTACVQLRLQAHLLLPLESKLKFLVYYRLSCQACCLNLYTSEYKFVFVFIVFNETPDSWISFLFYFFNKLMTLSYLFIQTPPSQFISSYFILTCPIK